MEHNSPTNNVAAAFGGSLFAAYGSIKQLLQAPINYSYRINWAETFQVCWKAAIGAFVGLIVKFFWDEIFTTKKKNKMKIPPFIIELIQRLATSNPKFFKWIQLVSGIVAVIAFIPDLLTFLDITHPNWIDALNDKAVKVGALTAIIMAQLPNPSVKK